MTHQNNLATVSQFDSNAYESSQAAELNLNAAILHAEIASSYEEFLEIFDKFYADDVEVSSEDSPETIRGKHRVRSLLTNFLVPLHVIAEVGGLSISIFQTAIPGDISDETHSAWTLDFVGVSGRTCTVTWRTLRKWRDSLVVYEHLYEEQQNGGPLTSDDLSFDTANLS